MAGRNQRRRRKAKCNAPKGKFAPRVPQRNLNQLKTSDELADDWRRGGYPHKFKILRRDYEEQKFVVQAELLKLQAWVRSTRQRLVIPFEARGDAVAVLDTALVGSAQPLEPRLAEHLLRHVRPPHRSVGTPLG